MTGTNQSSSSPKVLSLCLPWHSIIHDDHVISDYFFTVLTIIINFLTCPFIILLNALFITAIRTKRRLQTMHNILLSCLAATDLLVGICAQPAFITLEIIVLDEGGSSSLACRLFNMIQVTILCLCLVSVLHLAVISIERFVAMKYPLRYESIVTKFRLIVAVGFCWFFVTVYFVFRMVVKLRVFPSFAVVLSSFLTIVFSHTYVYFVCRRHEIQIQSEQVSPGATAKFLMEKKAWKTTSIIIGGVLICYLPGSIIVMLPGLFPDSLIERFSKSSRPFIFSFYILNSLCNPIIYCWRSNQIRKASMQLLRKPANGSPS